jgi:enamine deaminase RidA (YjgF/YER057c/UK114 family)
LSIVAVASQGNFGSEAVSPRSSENVTLSASTDHLGDLTPDKRLHALGIILPPAAAAVGDYAPTAIIGNLLMTSGQLPWVAGDLKFKGKIGADLTVEQGYQAFRLSALNAVAQLSAALGSLDRVKQIVRLEGTLNCAPGFTNQPSALDGASHVINEIFGPRGRHTRMVYSNHEMPMDCATLVVLYAEIVPPSDKTTRFSANIRA